MSTAHDFCKGDVVGSVLKKRFSLLLTVIFIVHYENMLEIWLHNIIRRVFNSARPARIKRLIVHIKHGTIKNGSHSRARVRHLTLLCS